MSKFFSKALFIENIKLYWVVPALSLLAYLLFMIFPLFGADANEPWGPWGRTRIMMDILAMQNSILIISIMAVPAIAVLCITGQFFSKKRATALYSFPITKDQMFMTNVLSGVVLTLSPLVLVGLLLLIPVRFPGSLSPDHIWFWSSGFRVQFPERLLPGTLINPPLQVLLLIVRIAIGKLFFFAVFKTAFTLAGHKVIAILLAAVMPFAAIGMYALYVVMETFYVFGASGTGELFDLIFRYTFPTAAFISSGWSLDFTLHMYFWFAGLAVIFFVIAFFVNRRRKIERTGDSIVFTPVKNVLIFLVSLAMALFATAFAAVFFNMWMFTSSVVIYYLGLMIGFALGFAVGQMIAEKTFAIGHKLKAFPIFAGVAVGLYIIMLVCTQFIAAPIINRLPQYETVAEVWFTHWIPQAHDRIDPWAHRPVTNAEDIQMVLDIHQEIIDNRPLIFAPWSQYNLQTHGIAYVLHDGRQIRRRVVASWDVLEALGYFEFQQQAQPYSWFWTHEQWEEYDRQQRELWD